MKWSKLDNCTMSGWTTMIFLFDTQYQRHGNLQAKCDRYNIHSLRVITIFYILYTIFFQVRLMIWSNAAMNRNRNFFPKLVLNIYHSNCFKKCLIPPPFPHTFERTLFHLIKYIDSLRNISVTLSDNIDVTLLQRQ